MARTGRLTVILLASLALEGCYAQSNFRPPHYNSDWSKGLHNGHLGWFDAHGHWRGWFDGTDWHDAYAPAPKQQTAAPQTVVPQATAPVTAPVVRETVPNAVNPVIETPAPQAPAPIQARPVAPAEEPRSTPQAAPYVPAPALVAPPPAPVEEPASAPNLPEPESETQSAPPPERRHAVPLMPVQSPPTADEVLPSWMNPPATPSAQLPASQLPASTPPTAPQTGVSSHAHGGLTIHPYQGTSSSDDVTPVNVPLPPATP